MPESMSHFCLILSEKIDKMFIALKNQVNDIQSKIIKNNIKIQINNIQSDITKNYIVYDRRNLLFDDKEFKIIRKALTNLLDSSILSGEEHKTSKILLEFVESLI